MRAFNDVAPYTHLVDAEQDHPLSFFETDRRDGVRRVRRRPGRRGRGRGRHGRRRGTPPTSSTPPSPWCCRSPSTTRSYLGDNPATSRRRRPGSSSPARSPCSPSSRPRSPRCCCERAAEVGATVAREGMEFGVVSRMPAVGGQMLSLQGLRATVRRRVPAAVRRPPGAERRRRAGRGRGVRGGSSALDEELVRAAFAEVTSPGRLEIIRRSPTIVLDAAHNPHGAEAAAAALEDSFTFSPLIGVMGVMADKDHEGAAGRASSRTSRTSSAPRTPPSARCPPRSWPRPPREIFGEDRVSVAPRPGRRHRPGRDAGRGGRGVRRRDRVRRGAGHRLGGHRGRGPRHAAGPVDERPPRAPSARRAAACAPRSSASRRSRSA